MASAITVRWRVSTLECELRLAEGSGRVELRKDGALIATTTVGSAVEACEWAATHLAGGDSRKEREQTGTD